jgi:hypothetical protein
MWSVNVNHSVHRISLSNSIQEGVQIVPLLFITRSSIFYLTYKKENITIKKVNVNVFLVNKYNSKLLRTAVDVWLLQLKISLA